MIESCYLLTIPSYLGIYNLKGPAMMLKCVKKILIILPLILISVLAIAQTTTPAPIQAEQPSIVPTAPNIDAAAYVLMDANSGKIIAEKNMDQRRPPASLTKMMTLYLAFQELQSGTVQLDSKVRVSKKAWQMGGSKMFIRVGNDVTLENLIQGIIVDSGNDACVATAEYIAGSEDAFVNMMNAEAKALGMNNTHYDDCTGMPHEDHYATAHDLAILARAIILNFPQYYQFFQQKWFTYNGIRQPNRNRLLWRYPGADGLKTGHTNAAGFCLVASAKKDNMRLITVILGAPTDEARSDDSIQLLTYGFRFFETNLIKQAGSIIASPRVWYGAEKTVPATVAQDFYVTTPRNQFQLIKTETMTQDDLIAPINKGQAVGNIEALLNGEVIASQPLIASIAVAKGGIWRKSVDHVAHLFHGWFKKPATTKATPVTQANTITPQLSTKAAS